jgi:hypothetical protein
MDKPKIYFGAGSLNQLEKLYPERGFHILRIPEISNLQMSNIHNSLQGRVLSETIYQNGMPEKLYVQALQERFWQRIDHTNSVLLGVGGGSVMDVAKVLRFRPEGQAWLSKNLDTAMDGQHFFKIPLILAPTTAGTGSEVSPTATIWDFKNHHKHSFFGPQVLANDAIVDPCLCLGAPWIVSRDAAIDALSHALEAIWNRNSTSDTTRQAIEAAKIICEYLPRLQGNLENLEIREKLSGAALSAGLAMGVTQTALAHALSYTETATSQKSHGQSCAYWLPYVWQLLIQSKCDSRILLAVEEAVGQQFSTPIEMYQWLVNLGFLVYPPLDRDKYVEEQVSRVRLSARGKNFAGFEIDNEKNV